MEQCRKAGKSHWYHETQSTMSSQTPLSLMPEAAYVNDRFLLDLAVAETALTPFEPWLKPARQLADVLFPRTVLNDRLHTFSAYERMSTALTAAQVFGVQPSACRLPLRYQYAGPRTACRGGINRPGYRTHQSDHWVYRFSGAGSGDISGVLPSARA